MKSVAQMDPYIEKFNLLNLQERVHDVKKDVNKCNSSDPDYGRITSKIPSHLSTASYSSYPAVRSKSTAFVLANPAVDNSFNACGEVPANDTKINAYRRSPVDYYENGYRKIEPSRAGSALATNYLNNAGPPSGQLPSSMEYKLSKQHSCPVYENLDYYNNRATPQSPSGYYRSIPASSHIAASSVHSRSSSQDSKHSNSPRTSVAGTDNTFIYESSPYRRAQPQCPVGVRYLPPSAGTATKEYAFYESPAVYENIDSSTKSYCREPAKPGPQVPVAGGELKRVAPSPPSEHLLTAVQHRVITSSPHRSNVAQASATPDTYVQQPYYGVSAFPQSSSSPIRGPSRSVRNDNSNSSQNTNNLRVSPDVAVLKSSSSYSTSKPELDYTSIENFTADELSILSNKLLPYNVTPPRPMVISERWYAFFSVFRVLILRSFFQGTY